MAYRSKNTKSYSPCKSVLQFPYLTGTSIGVVNTYSATDDETLTSLDVYNNQQVWAAGTRPSHNDSVVLFYQNTAYTTALCYSQPNYYTAELRARKSSPHMRVSSFGLSTGNGDSFVGNVGSTTC